NEDVETPDLVETWVTQTGSATLVLTPGSVPGAAQITLKFPFGGETGTASATIYQDAIDLEADVLAVYEPVRANGYRLHPVPDGTRPIGAISTEDFGFHRHVDRSAPARRVTDLCGQPIGYSIDTWLPGSNAGPRVR